MGVNEDIDTGGSHGGNEYAVHEFVLAACFVLFGWSPSKMGMIDT